MQRKIIYIRGMHCVACEKLLEDEFRNVANVKSVKVDRRKNTAEIFYENMKPNFTEIKKTAEKYGYQAFEKKSETKAVKDKTDWTEWLKAGSILAAILLLYKVFQNLGFFERLNIQASEVTLGVAFLTGVVASVSTCLAVVGSVIIAFGGKYRSSGRGFYEQALKPNLQFHIGRVASFFFLGGILGAIGGQLSISGQFYFVVNILIAVIMLWLGLNILGIVPSISNFGIRMPQFFTRRWDAMKESEHKAAPFILGALSFFLPCGFTQSMQIFAIASGSFWSGGLALLAFSLGTFPALLILGSTASWTQSRKMKTFQKVAGFLIIIFAVYTFNSGLALKDVKGSILTTKKTETSSEETKIEKNNAAAPEKNPPASSLSEQVVTMKVNYNGFEPSTLKIKKGVPVKWIIKGEQVSGCTNQIIVPSLDIAKDIKSGDNIVKFTPKEKGTISFSCWMGMVRGKFIVE